MCLAVQAGDILDFAAMRAEWTIGPDPCLKPCAGLVVVVEDRIIEVRHGDVLT